MVDFNNIHKSWIDFFDSDFVIYEIKLIKKSIGKDINNFVDLKEEKNIENYYFPAAENVFRFAKCDLNNVKYVILGMEPYPSYFRVENKLFPVATGRSFEVANKNSFCDKIPQTSIINILKSLYYDKFGIETDITSLRNNIIEFNDKKKYYCFCNENNNKKLYILDIKNWFDWTEMQGVLWLNATLTVIPNNTNSHKAIWNNFMNELLRYIIKNNDVKFIIFGQDAYKRIKDIVESKKIIRTCHPATRINNTFVRDNCFKYMKDINFYK